MRITRLLSVALVATGCTAVAPDRTCDYFDTQEQAQAAVDAGDARVRDPDGDGVYCESLP